MKLSEAARDIEVRLLVFPRHQYVISTNLGRKLIRVQATTEDRAFIQKLRVAGRKWTQPEWVSAKWLEAHGCRMVDTETDRDLLLASVKVARAAGRML